MHAFEPMAISRPLSQHLLCRRVNMHPFDRPAAAVDYNDTPPVRDSVDNDHPCIMTSRTLVAPTGANAVPPLALDDFTYKRDPQRQSALLATRDLAGAPGCDCTASQRIAPPSADVSPSRRKRTVRIPYHG